MKLRFYMVTILFASTSLYAMEPHSQPPTTITDSTSTTVIPNTPQSNIPTPKLSEHLGQYNLNLSKEKISPWNPSKSLSASELAQQRNALYDAIKKPNSIRFKVAYQNYPAEFRNLAVINTCNHTCYHTAVAIEDEIDRIDTQLKDGKKHDYRAMGKYSLMETGYIATSALLALTTKMMVNSVDKLGHFTIFTTQNYRLVSSPSILGDTLIKLGIIGFASSIGITLLRLQFDTIKNAFKAWHHQDTLKQQHQELANSLKEIPTIIEFTEKTKDNWIQNARLDFSPFQKEEDIK